MDELTEDQRRVVALSRIAAEMGRDGGAVRSLLQLGLARLGTLVR